MLGEQRRIDDTVQAATRREVRGFRLRRKMPGLRAGSIRCSGSELDRSGRPRHVADVSPLAEGVSRNQNDQLRRGADIWGCCDELRMVKIAGSGFIDPLGGRR